MWTKLGQIGIKYLSFWKKEVLQGIFPDSGIRWWYFGNISELKWKEELLNPPDLPVSPRSSSTSDPALPSSSPLRHSRVSAAARLISSSRIQWPFFTAWARVPCRGTHAWLKAGVPAFKRNAERMHPDASPPQRRRSWPSHRLGSAAESGSAWWPEPPSAPAAKQLYTQHTS